LGKSRRPASNRNAVRNEIGIAVRLRAGITVRHQWNTQGALTFCQDVKG
jgi:hypothetical protein